MNTQDLKDKLAPILTQDPNARFHLERQWDGKGGFNYRLRRHLKLEFVDLPVDTGRKLGGSWEQTDFGRFTGSKTMEQMMKMLEEPV